ncbi:MAG: DUF1810 domain-containing protein [Opitutaceae bacterium]|nr:DUF1810 domain-containing protein [Cytophagales bacterium]
MDTKLDRFISAQKRTYLIAKSEIKNGKKQSHWMWFVFPQIKGLGYSETSKFYGIENVHEAKDYLEHPILGSRLIDICNELLLLKNKTANQVFGSPDDLKLKSSMTLFDFIQTEKVFKNVLEKYFNGERDQMTLNIIAASQVI